MCLLARQCLAQQCTCPLHLTSPPSRAGFIIEAVFAAAALAVGGIAASVFGLVFSSLFSVFAVAAAVGGVIWISTVAITGVRSVLPHCQTMHYCQTMQLQCCQTIQLRYCQTMQPACSVGLAERDDPDRSGASGMDSASLQTPHVW